MIFLISGKKSANRNSPKFNDKRSDDKKTKLFCNSNGERFFLIGIRNFKSKIN